MKYESRHSKRDLELPAARQKLLHSMINDFKSNEEIIGVFLGGSIATGNDDLYSDIDLRIVVNEQCYKKFIQEKQIIAGQFGNVLFFEDLNPSAPYTIAHYEPFIKLDLFIYTFQTLTPSIWLQGISIMHDPTGKLLEILRTSEQLVYQVSRAEIVAWTGKVFAYIHEVYRRAMREEYYYALTMMNNLRSLIVKGWCMEAGRQSNDAWDWSKIEGKRSTLEPWQLSMLSQWSCGRDQEEIMKTLISMIPELRRIHVSLCGEEESTTFDKIVNLVL
jgi:predicted nucleotidyltransferase